MEVVDRIIAKEVDGRYFCVFDPAAVLQVHADLPEFYDDIGFG